MVRAHPDRFDVLAITGRGNIELLAEQAKLLHAKMAVTADANRLRDLQNLLSGTGIAVAAGDAAMIEAASMPADVTVAAIVGFDGLRPTMAALRHSRRLAFVSKECLVCAGDLFLSEARAHGCEIIPTDSEHSAIFQILHARTDEAM
ncbi:1-deoxy-D-xylulose-5-phosphate reductoisomerase, partial [bacterium]|nr:1-deoxy-D-xylulose-5-phosphate reductoisomerase [bacterium]